MDRKALEIMAPAGSFECLMAAIEGGADSVYFGVGRLDMRSRSAAKGAYCSLAVPPGPVAGDDGLPVHPHRGDRLYLWQPQ